MPLTHTQRCDAFDKHREAGTLTRRQWQGLDAQGRELACALAAFSPEAGDAGSAGACPADALPTWFAHLVPWLDDAGTEAAWPGQMARLGAVLRAWPTLTPETTERLHQQVRAACVREAMAHTTNSAVLSVCEDIAATLERGEWPTEAQWAAARAAERAAARVGSSKWEAWAAARAAAEAAWAAAEWAEAAWAAAAAEAAMRAARAAAAWAAPEAARAAMRAAADRLTDRILTLCEEAQAKAQA